MRAAEPDEAIASGISGESGLDDEYERIHVMKFDKEQDRRARAEASLLSRRKSTKNKRWSKSPPRKFSPPLDKDDTSDEDIKSWELVQKDDFDREDYNLKRNLSASSSGSFVQRSSLRDSSSNIRGRNRSTTRENRETSSQHKLRYLSKKKCGQKIMYSFNFAR